MEESIEVSVVLPTFNESGNILHLLDEIHEVLSATSHEILVVDDNSPDGTHSLVAKSARNYVELIHRTSRPGLGYSIRCGVEKARGEVIVIMDSDFNHQPKYLPFILDALIHFDCVSASRHLYGGGMGVKWEQRIHNKLSSVFSKFVRLLTGVSMSDTLYGFIGVRKQVLEEFCFEKIFWGYGDYSIRLLYFFIKSEKTILEFPAVNGNRRSGKSNTRFLHIFCRYTIETIKLALKERITKNRSLQL